MQRKRYLAGAGAGAGAGGAGAGAGAGAAPPAAGTEQLLQGAGAAQQVGAGAGQQVGAGVPQQVVGSPQHLALRPEQRSRFGRPQHLSRRPPQSQLPDIAPPQPPQPRRPSARLALSPPTITRVIRPKKAATPIAKTRFIPNPPQKKQNCKRESRLPSQNWAQIIGLVYASGTAFRWRLYESFRSPPKHLWITLVEVITTSLLGHSGVRGFRFPLEFTG
jgi:hypothetical protein